MLAISPAMSSDQGDAPQVARFRAADIADHFLFLDPNDNSRVILGLTVSGFIVASEAINFGLFDENLRYRVEIETTGDAHPDHFLDVTFTPKQSQDPARPHANGRRPSAPLSWHMEAGYTSPDSRCARSRQIDFRNSTRSAFCFAVSRSANCLS
jgi:hypothetical protein